jgi:dihydroneopterin aldolase
LSLNPLPPAQPGEPIGPAGASLPAATLDIVFIEGLRGETVIGIHENELHATQPIVIDLHAGLPRAEACSTDKIGRAHV